MQTLSVPTAQVVYPAGTLDTPWTFAITGTAADGSSFADSVNAATPSTTYNLPVGVFTLVVSKNGVSSLPSDPFTVSAPTTVLLTVPDATQKAMITSA